MKFWGILAACWLAALGGTLVATESAGPGAGGSTGALGELTTRPLRVYSPRGRRDPFVPPMGSPGYGALLADNLRISQLVFVGTLTSGAKTVALFRAVSGPEMTYSLRDGRLFDPTYKPVQDVKGRILAKRTVQLTQGEEKLTFTLVR